MCNSLDAAHWWASTTSEETRAGRRFRGDRRLRTHRDIERGADRPQQTFSDTDPQLPSSATRRGHLPTRARASLFALLKSLLDFYDSFSCDTLITCSSILLKVIKYV